MIISKHLKNYINIVNNNPIFTHQLFKRQGWKKEDINKEADIVFDLMNQFSFTEKDCSLNIEKDLDDKEDGQVKRFELKRSDNKFKYLIQGNTENSHIRVSVNSRNIPYWGFFEKKLRNTLLYYFLFDIDVFLSEKEGDILMLGTSVSYVLNVTNVYLKHSPITKENNDIYQKEMNDEVKKQLLKTKKIVDFLKNDLK